MDSLVLLCKPESRKVNADQLESYSLTLKDQAKKEIISTGLNDAEKQRHIRTLTLRADLYFCTSAFRSESIEGLIRGYDAAGL